MKKRHLLPLLAFGASALIGSQAMASPVKLDKSQLDSIVAGTGEEPPAPTLKGNNGWGNGADGTNPGSFKGKTAPSKSTNSSVPAAGKVNTNPTTSNGR